MTPDPKDEIETEISTTIPGVGDLSGGDLPIPEVLDADVETESVTGITDTPTFPPYMETKLRDLGIMRSTLFSPRNSFRVECHRKPTY
jgi:hypothetical protein